MGVSSSESWDCRGAHDSVGEPEGAATLDVDGFEAVVESFDTGRVVELDAGFEFAFTLGPAVWLFVAFVGG